MKQASFRAQSLFFLLLLGISTLWGQQPPHAAKRSGNWRLVGTGDYPDHDVSQTTGSDPAAYRCDSSFTGYTAVCWSGNCTYKNVPTGSCTGGANPGRMYTCDAATSSPQYIPTPPPTASQELQTNRFGGDYRSLDLTTADPALCQKWCLIESKCVAWTYVNPGVQGSLAKCWLKSTIPAPSRNACCVSGTKEPNSPVQTSQQTAPSSPQTAPTTPTAVEPASFRTLNIAGTWQYGARGETWTFTALGGDRYKAVAKGAGNAAGVATVIGNRVRIDYTWQEGGEHRGYYQLTIETGGRNASGRFSDDRSQQGSVTMSRIASR